MAVTRVIAIDLAPVFSAATGGKLLTTLAWGDEVKVEKVTSKHVEIKLRTFRELEDGSFQPESTSGFICPSRSSKIKPADVVAKKSDLKVLKIDFVDVQQGDASIIETPKGQVILVDGGDNQLFARYLAGRYPGTSATQWKEIDAIVVTHGDADHFAGLTEIHDSETHSLAYKRLFIHPRRVYHNGLVKRPGKKANGTKRKNIELLGQTKTVDGKVIITGLERNLLTLPDSEMNAPFRRWKGALKAWKKRGPIDFRRLSFGDDDAFDFLRQEGLDVQVLGPMVTEVGATKGLRFLGNPKKGPRIGHESLGLGFQEFTGKSASHTINGHSVVLRVQFGRWRLLSTGDLNDESGRILTRSHNGGELDLRSEIFKVPHHGSADFSAALLQAVSPVVSVVSSGDESARKEFIHPRSTLMGALGKYSRIDEPLIFVTELVAFFQIEGYVTPEFHRLKDGKVLIENGEAAVNSKAKRRFFAFRRTAFGIVKVRTDGERLLVYTNSGQEKLKEAYAYTMDDLGKPVPVVVRRG